jgi:two-component system sensor histidine kinase HydH
MEGPRSLVTAIDPAERPEVSAAFAEWAVRASAELTANERPVLDGPREGPDGRQFFVYARPTVAHEAVVLISEARFLLEPVLHSRNDSLHYFLVDPSGSVWMGCWQASTCRAFTRTEWPAIPGIAELMAAVRGAASGQIWSDDTIPAGIGLPARPGVAAWDSVEHDGRGWTAGVVASAQILEARERSLQRRLILTSVLLVLGLGGIAAFIVVHQRRAAALTERLRHAQEVAHLRERTDQLLDNVSVGLVGVTREGRIALMNRFLVERLPALDPGASIAVALSDGDATTAALVREALEEALRSGRPQLLRGDDVKVLSSKAGHYDVRVIPLKQPAQDVNALVLLEDQSELKHLEKQLVRAEKLVTVGVLTAGLAHEIGTPLGIIRGRAEVLLGKIADPALARDVEAVIRQIDQIGSTIRQVLDFAHTQPVEMRAVAAAEAVGAAVKMLEWRLRQKGLLIRVEDSGGVARIAADPDQLQQVLVNVLMNACDACEKQGLIIVRLRPAPAEGTVVVEIQDNGCGIAPGDLNTVFDPFFTTKKRGEGTGLGLSVAASIVRNHHGQITLASEQGVGTVVTLVWPVARGRALTPAPGVAGLGG